MCVHFSGDDDDDDDYNNNIRTIFVVSSTVPSHMQEFTWVLKVKVSQRLVATDS